MTIVGDPRAVRREERCDKSFQARAEEPLGNFVSFTCMHNFGEQTRQVWQDKSCHVPGLSLRAGDWGFPPATVNVAPGYFQRKIKEK